MRLRTIVVVALAAVAALSLPVAAEAKKKKKPPKVTVMTRNVYLGSDLTGALLAPSQTEVFEEGAIIWNNVQETNFIHRAKLLADEIIAADADLVGLQEVALWRRDFPPDGPASPAQDVVYDFLTSLLGELNERGGNYRVASVQNEADFEIPLDFDDDGNPDVPSFDGRLTMRDAILVKDDKNLKTKSEQSENYGFALPVDLPPTGSNSGEDIEVLRGYNAVDVVKKKGKKTKKRKKPGKAKFRFVNTHLEAFSAFIRNAQASSLVNGPVVEHNKPVILVGDLNSDPDDPSISPSPPEPIPTPNAAAYNAFANAGFLDVGVTADTGCSTSTGCHGDDLLAPPPADFDMRIDHILTKPGLTRLGGGITGIDPGKRTPTGLWSSDHAGVYSTLKVPR